MAAVTTELKIKITRVGEAQLTKLSASLNQVAKRADAAKIDFKSLASELKKVQTTTGPRSVSDLKNYRNAWRDIADSVDVASKEFREARAEAARLDRQLEKTTARRTDRPTAAAGLRGGLAAIAGVVGTGEILQQGRQAIGASLERGSSEQRLRALSAGFDAFASTVDVATRAAQRFNLSQTDAQQQLAQVYGRLRPLGLTLQEIESTFVGFNTAARLSGATASESAGAFLQLSQALGSGVLRGEEFNSISEQAPLVLSAIAEVMDEPVGALKDLAKEGQITSDIVLKALQDIETKGAARLADVLDTPAAKLEKLNARFEDLRVALGNLSLPAFISIVEELTLIIEQSTERVELYALGFEQLKLDIESLTKLMPPWGNATVKALQFIGTEANIVYKLFQGIDLLTRNAAKRRQATLGPAPTEYDITQGADLDMNAIRLASERADRLKALKNILGDTDKDKISAGKETVDITQKEFDLRKQIIDARRTDNEIAEIQLSADLKRFEILGAQIGEREKTIRLLEVEQNEAEALGKIYATTIEERIKLLEDQEAAEFRAGKAIADALNKADKNKIETFGESFKEVMQNAYKEATDLGTALGGVAVNAVDGLTDAIVEFATTGKAAFADFARSIISDLAKIFLKAAIFKTLDVAFPGLGLGAADGAAFDRGGQLTKYASGGVVNAPTFFRYQDGGQFKNGVMGEAGPEAILPLKRGSDGKLGVTLNESGMRESMSRYSRGARGGSVIPENGGGSNVMDGGGGTAVAAPIDVRYTVERINSVDYVTADQFQQGMQQAANQGAKQGEQQTLKRLQMSSSTRKRLGM